MNRFGSNSFEHENDQFAQNQRFGRLLGENNPRPWNEGNNPYRRPENLHYNHPHYRPDAPHDHYQQGRRRYNGERPQMPGAPYDDPARHHDDRYWTERNNYKDHDYRYRSGHRGYWHEDYDENYEGRHHPPHPDNFFVHIGQGIRDGWNNLFHRHPEEPRNEDRSDRGRRPDDNRNYVPNPHWPYTQNRPAENPNYVPNPNWPYTQNRPAENPNFVPNPHWPYNQNRPEDRGRDPRQNPQNPNRNNAGPDYRDEDFYNRDSNRM
jgi:hypothetical protein